MQTYTSISLARRYSRRTSPPATLGGIPRAACVLVLLSCLGLSPGAVAGEVFTLDQAVASAVENRVDMGVREAIRDGLAAQKAARRAEKAISLDVYGSGSGTRFASQFSLALTKRLYGGRGFKFRIGAADAKIAAAEARIVEQQRAVERGVEVAYWNLLAAQLEVADLTRLDEQLASLMATVGTRFEQGTISRQERDRARIRWLDQQVLAEEAKGRQHLRATDFLVALGADAGQELPTVVPEDPRLPAGQPDPGSSGLAQMIDEALRSRPEIEALEASVEAQEQELVASKTNNLFTVDISGGYRWRGYDYLVVDQNEAVNSFAFLALIGRYQSNWRLNRARAALVETEQRLAQLDLEAQRTDISWQVSKALLRVQTLARQLDAVRETVELSESNLQSTLAAWEYGRVSAMDVFTSHITVTERRIRLHRLESDLAIAAAELRWSTGGSP